MKKILLILMTFVSLSAFAGHKGLSNGEAAFWEDATPIVEWESMAVPIQLSGKCDFNVVGTVYIRGGRSGDTHQQNFVISAGSTKTNVLFDGLVNGSRYYVTVEFLND